MTALERVQRRRQAVEDVQTLFVEHLMLDVEPQDLDPDAPLFGSGHALDSIDAVELVVALENRFGVRLQESRVLSIPHLRTVNTVVDLVIAETQEAA
ncbi:MAG: acyl carrier protein [Proteobacteria bacterium]|nr:acyl carrier protein [Pseudomonadota bacterium]